MLFSFKNCKEPGLVFEQKKRTAVMFNGPNPLLCTNI